MGIADFIDPLTTMVALVGAFVMYVLMQISLHGMVWYHLKREAKKNEKKGD